MDDIEEYFDRSDVKLVQKERPKLRDLQETLYPMRSKWYQFGVQLDVPTDTLDTISSSSGNFGNKLLQMLKEWVKQMESQGGVTWEAVVEVLKRRSIGENQLARDVARQWCKLDSGMHHTSCRARPKRILHKWVVVIYYDLFNSGIETVDVTRDQSDTGTQANGLEVALRPCEY